MVVTTVAERGGAAFMQKKFRRWFALLMSTGFVLIVAISYCIQTDTASSNADVLINQRVVDIQTRVDDYLDQKVEDVTSIAAEMKLGDKGQVFVAQDGTIVSASENRFIGETPDELGIATVDSAQSPSSMVYDIAGTEYRTQSELYRGYAITVALPTSEIYIVRNRSLIRMTLLSALLFCVVSILIGVLVQKLVIDGILDVNKTLSKITDGDLDEAVDVRSSPEFEALSDGINTTVDALKDHIAKEASRIDADLALAKAIQLGNLQTVFPAFPDHDEFDLYAHMAPAREVGGDFYDMFMRDETHLSCVIADVSGKGLPAAMFMMEAKSYINSLALGCASLCQVFDQANEKLCANNDTGLFVTAFMIDLDLSDGSVEFVNAGHNPPLICHVDGSCEYLDCEPGFVLGGMEGVSYRFGCVSLKPGERFVAYTDGVTEALDENGKLYGEERLLEFLDGKAGLDAESLVNTLFEELARYRGKAEQADDITVLALDYEGSQVKP